MPVATAPQNAAEKSSASKNTWEKVITLTPVILTVMATLLAGLSSSEMTQSMYYRSVAAQNQSKAGDQWAFFQAKRVRRTMVEAQLGLMSIFANPGKLDPAMLLNASRRLTAKLKQAEKQAEQLTKTSASEAYLKAVQESIKQSEQNTKALEDELKKESVTAQFGYLGTRNLPKIEEGKFEHQQLDEVVEKIAQRKPEKDIAPLVLKVQEDTLHQALTVALDNASQFDKAGDGVSDNLRTVDRLVNQQGMVAATYYQAFLEFEGSNYSTSKSEKDPTNHSLNSSEEQVRKAADDLNNLYKRAFNDFTARRYQQEGRYNQRLAELYEVQVQRNSALSDSHRQRSRNFFFGMLGAQAGVAIASFSLAARKKSLLWALATIAGLGALIFSAYVYLKM